MDYTTIPSADSIARTVAALEARNIHVHLVATKEAALAKIQELIPKGKEVMSGGSTTLDQIGYTDFLKSEAHPWHNVKDAIVAETDPVAQTALRVKSISSEYFLGSVHAIAETGEVVIASATGSQIAPYAFSSPHIIWVAGAQKIVPTLQDAFDRIHSHVFPLEDARMKKTGAQGSVIGMMLVFERLILPHRTMDLVLVNEPLGF